MIDRSNGTWRFVATGAAGLAMLASACTPPPTPPPAGCTPVVLDDGHVDGPGFAFEDGEWDVHVHDHDNDIEYEPECAILDTTAGSETTIPAGPAFSFLGTAGDPVWILPQVEDPSLLFLGYATEEIDAGVLVDDELDWSLAAVAGPGEFIAYSVDGFGTPTVLFDSSNPMPQTVTIDAGTHTHVNWAFTAPGDYTVSYEAEATPVGDAAVSSGLVDFSYHVGA